MNLIVRSIYRNRFHPSPALPSYPASIEQTNRSTANQILFQKGSYLGIEMHSYVSAKFCH